ncbi:MAG: RsmE family RNA methyltransferase, partial [Patescibacteria group bacterium]
MVHHSRFFVEEKIGGGESFILSDKAQIHQISRVLRLKEGSDIILLDNSGFEYSAVIESLAEDEIILKILEKRESEAEPKIKLALYQSLLKKDKMEWIFEKGTELGVSKFVPVLSKYCVKTDLNFERAKKIIREAAEQCGRAKLPELSEISDFEKAAEFRAREGGLNFILDVDAGISLKKIVHEKKPS